MLFQKKERDERSSYPMLHMADSLQEYHRELVQGEAAALRELHKAAGAYREVQGEQERLQQGLREFDRIFLELRQTAIELAAVREEIFQAVAQARREMELLGSGARGLEDCLAQLQGGSGALEQAAGQAGRDAGALAGAAQRAGALAVETALRGARSEEEGFAQGLAELERLSEETLTLSGALGLGLEDTAREGALLRDGVGGAARALAESVRRAEQARRAMEKLTRTADRIASAQSELIGIVRRSEASYQSLCGFAKRLRSRSQEAARHVDRAGRLGTLQGAVFEDMDNLLSQLAPLVSEYDL